MLFLPVNLIWCGNLFFSAFRIPHEMQNRKAESEGVHLLPPASVARLLSTTPPKMWFQRGCLLAQSNRVSSGPSYAKHDAVAAHTVELQCNKCASIKNPGQARSDGAFSSNPVNAHPPLDTLRTWHSSSRSGPVPLRCGGTGPSPKLRQLVITLDYFYLWTTLNTVLQACPRHPVMFVSHSSPRVLGSAMAVRHEYPKVRDMPPNVARSTQVLALSMVALIVPLARVVGWLGKEAYLHQTSTAHVSSHAWVALG